MDKKQDQEIKKKIRENKTNLELDLKEKVASERTFRMFLKTERDE